MTLGAPTSFHCLPVYAASHGCLGLPTEERRVVVAGMIKHADAAGFPAGSLDAVCSMPWHEEAAVMLVMLVWLGGPLVWALGGLLGLLFGAWSTRAAIVAASLVLAGHPMPGRAFSKMLYRSRFTLWLYKVRRARWSSARRARAPRA